MNERLNYYTSQLRFFINELRDSNDPKMPISHIEEKAYMVSALEEFLRHVESQPDDCDDFIYIMSEYYDRILEARIEAAENYEKYVNPLVQEKFKELLDHAKATGETKMETIQRMRVSGVKRLKTRGMQHIRICEMALAALSAFDQYIFW